MFKPFKPYQTFQPCRLSLSHLQVQHLFFENVQTCASIKRFEKV